MKGKWYSSDRMGRITIAWLLSVVMMVTFVPVFAFAETVDKTDDDTQVEQTVGLKAAADEMFVIPGVRGAYEEGKYLLQSAYSCLGILIDDITFDTQGGNYGILELCGYEFVPPHWYENEENWDKTPTLLYWNTKPNGSGVIYRPGQSVKKSELSGKTLYAIWGSKPKTMTAIRYTSMSAPLRMLAGSTANPPQAQIGDTITVTFDDGSTEVFTYSEKYGLNDFCSGNTGLKTFREWSTRWSSNQSFNAGDSATFVYVYGNLTSNAVRVEIIGESGTDQGASVQTGGGTVIGSGTSASAAEQTILSMNSDTDPAGSAISPLRLNSSNQGKTSITLKWTSPGGTAKVVVYGNICNVKGQKYSMTKIQDVSGNSLVVSAVNGAALKKGTYHKFIALAVDANNNVVAISKVIHVTTKGGKWKNYNGVKIKNAKKFKKLKVGKALKIKSKAKGKKVKKHAGLRYESANPAVASVTGSGKVKGVSRGTTYITVYAQNGKSKSFKVTVK